MDLSNGEISAFAMRCMRRTCRSPSSTQVNRQSGVFAANLDFPTALELYLILVSRDAPPGSVGH